MDLLDDINDKESTMNKWHAMRLAVTDSGALVAMLAWVAASSLVATPANAGNNTSYHHRATVISCVGSESATWSPGLTYTVQPYLITVDNQWPSCTIEGRPASLSASSHAQFSVVESCAQLGVPAEATWLIKWSDGKTSTFRFEATVNVSGGNFMITAPETITDGRYKGNTAIATFTLLNSAGLFANGCDTPQGVTSISGPSSLVILND